MTIFNVNETINEVFGTADKILDFFLRRKRVLAKYTKEAYHESNGTGEGRLDHKARPDGSRGPKTV